MTQTIIDEGNRTFLVLRLAVARDDSAEACEGGTRWCAHVCDPASPLAGLYAFAETLNDAKGRGCGTGVDGGPRGRAAAVRAVSDRPGRHPRRHDEQHVL